MDITAIIFFALAALMGIWLLTYVLRSIATPKSLALLHGLVAASGLVILIIYTFNETPDNRPYASVVLFVIAALGGFVLIYRDLTGKALPRWLALLHGLLAVSGFVILLVSILSK